MRALRMLFVAALALSLLPAAAQAQTCVSPVELTLGQVVSSTTNGGTNRINVNGCFSSTLNGPEKYYKIRLTQETRLHVNLTQTGASWFSVLTLHPEINGDCSYTTCFDAAYSSSNTQPVDLLNILSPGTYYLIIDGFGGAGIPNNGAYTLSVVGETCTDNDGDGWAVYDAANCQTGADCNDNDPAINPYAWEVCGNGVDENCDADIPATCPTITVNTTLNCPSANGSVNTTSQTNDIDDYCGTGAFNQSQGVDIDWTGNDYIMRIAPTAGMGFKVSHTPGTDLYIDLWWLSSYGPTNTPNAETGCLDVVGPSLTDAPYELYGWMDGGKEYFFSIDALRYVTDYYNGSDTYSFTCYTESCTSTGTIACGGTVNGTTVGGTNHITVYQDVGYPFPAADKAYTFTAAADGLVNAHMTITTSGKDLGLLVVEDTCSPGNVIGMSDRDNTSNPNEDVYFLATAGTTYYLIVDGWTTADTGAFTLNLNCCTADEMYCGACIDPLTDTANCGYCGNVCGTGFNCILGSCIEGCPTGETDCSGICYDLTNNTNHCGACDNDCAALPHTTGQACVNSACTYNCATNWGDCTADPGCESDLLNDEAYCGDCSTSCNTGAGEFCAAGVCDTSCPTGQTDCGGTCYDLTNTPAHCGDCNTDCNTSVGHVTNVLCTSSVCDYDTCAAGYMDCDTNRLNGCELLETASTCNCTTDCTATVVNVTTVLCTAHACDYDTCAAGYMDCDGNRANGCEAQETAATCNCTTDCTATVANVTTVLCTAHACDYDTCANGYFDCDTNRANGCEQAQDDTHCGDCTTDCTAAFTNASGSCNAGACEMGACAANFGDCDTSDANGCETDLTSNTNCGSCGNACGNLEACTATGGVYDCSATCADADGDGFASSACGGTDCNDNNNAVYPGAAETCNDADDNCNGSIDEGLDGDGDGYKPCGASADCNDADASVHPGATEICGDTIDQDCNGSDLACTCPDVDQDGYQDSTCGGQDCADTNPAIHPGATETCDGVDNDCDGTVDGEDICKEDSGCGCAASGSPSSGLFLLLGLGLIALRRRTR